MPKLEVEKALALSKIDNAIDAGSTAGTETELGAAVSNSANWTLGNSPSLNLSTEAFPINALESTNSVHLTFGNPSNATTDINEQDNYLLVKDQYALSYNNSLKLSNWASWQLNTSWLGTAARQDDFRPDLSLPAGWYQVDDNDYQGSGFDRGHLVPSADRTASIEDNSATFFMTNMIPQAPDNNRNTWSNLEAFSRDLVIGDSSTTNDDKELYIVAGSYGVGGIGSNGSLEAIVTPGGNITIPERTWKAILVLDNPGDGVADVTVDTRVIAVDMPNEQDISTNWQDFLTSVDDLEVATGLDLFSNLPDEIEAVIEARVDGTIDGTGWIINEIHADPDGSIAGDANGDGTRNSSQDEFVELVNKTGGDVDISGWTLADGVSVRHTFPTGTIVPNQGAVVVFGGGTPTGSFGDATVQTASTGSLGLNNSGDTVTLNDGSADVTTVTYGSEGGNNQSLTRDPDLTGNLTAHSTATGSGGALFSPGTQIDGMSFNDSTNITSIHELQGSTDTSPLEGEAVIIEGIVVGDFQGSNGLSGFFVQEEDSDADVDITTSEGIFIFDDSSPTVDVSEGDKVQVSGTVVELNSSGTTLTQLSSLTDISIISSGNPLPTAAVVNDLVDANTNSLERYEGMRVNLTETLSVTEYFQLGRFGNLVLSSGGLLQQPTNVVLPGTAANDLQAANDLRHLILDDGSEDSFPDPIIFGRGGNPLSTTNLLRGGDTVDGLTGVLDQRFGEYRVQTNQGVNFNAVNEREATVPDVGGTIKVASFNVLNYFTTIDDGTNNARGANSSNEFTRQQDKLVSALQTIDADIVGLVELENDNDVTVQNLVDALNTQVGVGTYDWISTGTIGTDAIKVGMIYKTATISPVGSFAVLDNTVAPTFNDNRNRPSLVQTFQEIASGETLTVAVNHFKSKSSSGEATGADLDQGDGQGAWNATRTDAANALTNWLATDPTESGDADFLIIGDLNAYAKEAPITAIQGVGYTNLIEKYSGKDAYSFNFDGQFGYLDHALANSSLESQITGVAEWHINADEPNVFDYNDALIDAGENSSNPPVNPPSLYQVDPFRTSDHDPVIIGLNLSSTSVVNGTNRRDTLTGTNGDDTLTGFGGRDILTGNAGSDRFTYLRYSDLGDVITDFEVGVDRIVLTDLLDSFNYNGTDPFADGYLDVAAYSTADSILLVDFDGGGDTLRPFILLENVTEVDMENSSNFVF